MATIQESLDAFVSYVQSELFRRPFLNSDTDQETVMVRRGGGPRQLTGIEMAEGQILAKVGGQLVGASVGDLGGGDRKFLHEQDEAALEWVVNHGYDSVNVEVFILDENNARVEPNEIVATDADTVTISFTKVQAGKALLRWYD